MNPRTSTRCALYVYVGQLHKMPLLEHFDGPATNQPSGRDTFY